MSKNINKPEENWQKLTHRSLCEFIINLSTSGPQCKFDHPNNDDPTVIPIRDLKNIDFLDAIDLLEHGSTPLHFEYQTLPCSCHIRLALAHQTNSESPAIRHCVFHRAHQFAQLMKNLCQFTQSTSYASTPEIPTDTHQDLPPIIPIDTPDSTGEHEYCLKKLHELADKLKPFNRAIEIDEEKMLVYYHNHNIPESKINPRTYSLSGSGCRRLQMIYYNIAKESHDSKSTKRQSATNLTDAENLPIVEQPTVDQTNNSSKSTHQSRSGRRKKAADDNCIKQIESYAAKLNQLGDLVAINYKKKSVTHTYHTRTGKPKTDILPFEKATAERFKNRATYLLRSHQSINADKPELASSTTQTDDGATQSSSEHDHQNHIDSQASSNAPTLPADVDSNTTIALLSNDNSSTPSDVDDASANSADDSIVIASIDDNANDSPSTNINHDTASSVGDFTTTASAENNNSDVIAPPPHQRQE